MKRWLSILATAALLIQLQITLPLALAEETDTATTPTEINLQEDNGLDINDSGTFDVSKILQTNKQNTDRFIKAPEGPVAAVILAAINFITLIFGAVAMLFIIAGGLLMIVSEGDENRLQKGKGILAAAIIGLVISMFSYIIVRFFQSIFY